MGKIDGILMEINREDVRAAVGVLCCGTCSLRYDREKLLRRLPELMPEVQFVKAKSQTRYAALLVMHGCEIACTSEFNMAVSEKNRVRMGSPEELSGALDRLREIIGLKDERG